MTAEGNNGETVPRKSKWSAGGIATLCLWALLLVYLIAPMVMRTSFYPDVILYPGTPVEAAYKDADKTVGAPHEDFHFANRHGDQLHAVVWRVPGATKWVIYHHGNAGNISSRAPACAVLHAIGANLFIYDYSGYGYSKGKPTLNGVLEDGVDAFDFVKKQLKVDARDIINYGESIGSGTACYVATHRPAGGLVLQSVVPSIPMVAKANVGIMHIYPDFMFPEPHMDSVQAVREIHCPIAVISGGKDGTIPWPLAKLVYDNANQPKQFVLLKDSRHNSIESGDDLKAYIKAVRLVMNQSSDGAKPEGTVNGGK